MSPETRLQDRNFIFALILTILIVAGLLVFLRWPGFSGFLQQRSASNMETNLQPADAALHAGDLKRARSAFDKMLADDRHNPSIYLAICQECQSRSQWALAIEYANLGLQNCKQASPGDRSDLYMNLAGSYAEAEPAHPQRSAIAAAENAWKLDPHNPEKLNGLGYVLADNDLELDRAQQLLSEALGLMKDTPDSISTRLSLAEYEDSYGWTLYKQHKYPVAVGVLTQANEDIGAVEEMMQEEGIQGVQPVSGDLLKIMYYHLGTADRLAGRPEEARRALNIALYYDPKYDLARKEMAALSPTSAVQTDSIPLTAAPTHMNRSDANGPTLSSPPATSPSPGTFTPLSLPPGADIKTNSNPH